MDESRRDFLKLGAATAAAAAATSALATPAIAQGGYPNRPFQLVVPFNPGGGADRSMRLFAPYLAQELGQPVNVTNQPGGGGWVAWSEAARWDPDEHDHMIQLINMPHVFSYLDPRMERTETLESFNFLCMHSYDPANFVVRDGDDRFQNIQDFLAYVADHPGEITMSTTAVGSDNHMTIAFCEKYLDNFEVQKLYGAGDEKKITELLGNVSDAVAANTGYYIPYMLERQMRAIVVFHDERWPEMPNIPTFEEVTGLRNIAGAGRTLAVANDLPQDKYDFLLQAVERALNNPEYMIREMQNRNQLTFLVGEELQNRMHEFRDYVADIEYWEMDT
jgi:tripartite-type tricarboxylate transporter receptor subunit TctC